MALSTSERRERHRLFGNPESSGRSVRENLLHYHSITIFVTRFFATLGRKASWKRWCVYLTRAF